ncbi:hypothetical protein LDL08_16825 [Nonomuraea glycinis]|uniref:Uncharacterized protein n=1 Tax=Nonomuraea glycinis TaxID=2047744 RepID=A0A918E5Q3_9ACTN|nr:hypothetical protein [Nonomuraea glycinis]MCA2177856.1 hypothetical protein [Nonomuraea glycinis]GGP06551.1 hypothetical protein GCM10012278_30620 [Nonomuraea glycinis]
MTSPRFTPLDAARNLRHHLATHGVEADVNDGYGMAVVSVWVGLVVWCDIDHYWWRTGWDAKGRRPLYGIHPLSDPERAARRVALRYVTLRQGCPPQAQPMGAPR